MLILLLRLFALFRAVSMRRFNGHLQSMFLEKYEKKYQIFHTKICIFAQICTSAVYCILACYSNLFSQTMINVCFFFGATQIGTFT